LRFLPVRLLLVRRCHRRGRIAVPRPRAAIVVESGGDLSIYREFINASDTDSSDIEPVLSVDNGFVSLPASSDLFLLTAAADEEAVPTMTLRKKLIKNPLPKRRLYSSWMIVPYSVVRLW
ncbi:hypothetical protein LINPERPRIM_LOCUS15842, partial [Linum perenne]